VAQPRPLEPMYSFGAYAVAIPGWGLGTMLGVIAGNVLPLRVVSALSVALFGMFLAVIIPPARRDKAIRLFVPLSFAASLAAAYLPGVRALSAGTRTILLTLLLSCLAAALFPVREEADDGA